MLTDITHEAEIIQTYYRDRLARYGDTVEAVGWNAVNQRRRFELLTHGWDTNASVLDVGCGRADLWVYLKNQGWTGTYQGVDVVPELVALAQKRVGTCCVMDASGEVLPSCDYALASGVFNLDLGDYGFRSATLMQRILSNMWAACWRGMAFDCLDRTRSDKVDNQWYAEASEVLQWVQALRPAGTLTRFDRQSLHGNLIVQVSKEGGLDHA